MKPQTLELVKEWNGVIGSRVNDYALRNNTRQVAEKFNGETYSRIHRKSDDSLFIEERDKGVMYPSIWIMTQDFSELEKAFEASLKAKL